MANEVTLSGSLDFDDDLTTEGDAVESRQQTSTGKRTSKIVQTIGITEEVLDLGDITSVAALMIRNLDPTNFVNVKTTTSGTIIARLDPDVNGDGKGGFVLFSRAGSGLQAPWAIADTAVCKVRITVIEL